MQSQIKTEIIIDAPKEKVWNILTDLESYEKWNPFIVKSSGRITPGARIQNTMLNGDSNMTFRPKVLTVKPNEYFDWLGSLWFKGLFDGNHYFKIEETGPGQVNLIHGENFSGILSAMILRKIGEDTRQNFIKMNQAIKALAELH